MNGLEQVVRAALEEHAQAAPSANGLGDAVRLRLRRRRRVERSAATIGLVAAVAAATVVPLELTTTNRNSVAVGATPTSAVPAGTQPVSFHGVEVFVPQAWTINDTRCGTAQHDTAIIEDDGSPTPTCATRQPPGLTVVRITDTNTPMGRARATVAQQPTTVDGKPARYGTGVPAGQQATLNVLVLQAPGVVISVESPDSAAARNILESARIVATDSFGCRAAVTTLVPSERGDQSAGAGTLVAGHPTSASICRYSGDRLARSAAVQPSLIPGLVDMLNGLPTGVTQPSPGYSEDRAACASDAQRGFVIRFSYPTRPPAEIYVHIGGCDGLSASNGTRTTKIDAQLVTLLTTAVGYDSSIPANLAGVLAGSGRPMAVLSFMRA